MDAAKPMWGRFISGELLEKWPKDERGEPVAPVFLTHCSSVDMDDVFMISMLQAYGIPAIRMHPESSGGLGKIVLGISGYGADIYVPETMLDDAIALMSAEPETEQPEDSDKEK